MFGNVQDDTPLSEEQASAERYSEITGADAEFLKVDQLTLFEMILVRPSPFHPRLVDCRRLPTFWTSSSCLT